MPQKPIKAPLKFHPAFKVLPTDVALRITDINNPFGLIEVLKYFKSLTPADQNLFLETIERTVEKK